MELVKRSTLNGRLRSVSAEAVALTLPEKGSLIATVETLRGKGRSLVPYEIPELSEFEEWLAESEIMGPNGPDEMFEGTTKRGIFKGWERLKSRFRKSRPDHR